MIKSTDVDVLPSWGVVQNFHISILPSLQILPEPHQGMFSALTEALKLTLQRILEKEKISITVLKYIIKLDTDGSSCHSMFKNSVMETNNNILIMFCVLELRQNELLIWRQDSPNSEFNQRPVMLQLGKESTESFQSQKLFNDHLKVMKETGIQLTRIWYVKFMLSLTAWTERH